MNIDTTYKIKYYNIMLYIQNRASGPQEMHRQTGPCSCCCQWPIPEGLRGSPGLDRTKNERFYQQKKG